MSSHCYCIALRRASRRLTAIYDDGLAPVGVNLAQFSLLRNIERKAPVSLTELGRLTELDRSTVGRNVKVLERMDFVALLAGKDQREANVVLTEGGRAVLAAGAPLWDAAQARVESALGAGNTKRLTALLDAL